jgi:hypothetical protein
MESSKVRVTFPVLQSTIDEFDLEVLPCDTIGDIKNMIRNVTGISLEYLELRNASANSESAGFECGVDHRRGLDSLEVAVSLSGGVFRSDLQDQGCNKCWYPFTFYCCCGWPCASCGCDCCINNCMKCGACNCD